MKRTLKILATFIIAVVILLMALPYFFKDKIEVLVKEEGNKMLNAQFDFSSLDISLIRNFPSVSVTLEDFYLKGVGQFENDTLVSAGEITAAVNIMSFFGNDGYEISKVLLDDVSVMAIVLPDSAVNWDVMKKTDDAEITVEDTVSSGATPSSIAIKLNKFKLDNFNLIYDDRFSGIYARIADMDATCSGDFGSAQTAINLNTEIEALTCRMGGVPFLNKAEIEADINVNADLENNKITFDKNSIRLNAIEAAINGWVVVADEGMNMDISLNSNSIGFKEILSLIPAIYTKDFDGLKTDGSATVTASAKGWLKGDSIVPQFDVLFDVKNAMFRYPSLPAGVENINITAKVNNPGGPIDGTHVAVNPLSFVMAGNPFSVIAAISNPVSDLAFDVSAKGKLDLGKIKDIYPLENMQLNGLVTADMAVKGRMSYIEKEKYDKINANGTISLNDMLVQMKDIPDVNIMNSLLTFTPQYLQLSETEVTLGNNDIVLDSRFENYMGYILKGTTLKGSLNVKSNKFNLNDFMSSDSVSDSPVESNSEEQSDTVVADTVAGGIIKVPDNIDFNMQAVFKEVLFDNMKFNNLQGTLLVKDSKVDMKNLSMNTMGGEVVVNGCYSTPSDAAPEFDAGFKLSKIVFSQAYDDLNVVRVLAPIFSGLTGDFSGHVNIDTKLDNNMKPIVSTLNGSGSLSTKDLSLNNVQIIQLVADIVKKPSLKDTRVKDLNLEFTINEGRVTTKPFDIKLGDYKMNLSGTTGLDQTIDYKGEITIPTSAGKLSKLGTVDMLIGGTFKSPKVSIDMESLAKKAAAGAAESLLDKVLGNSSDEEENTSSGSDKKKGAGKLLNKALDFLKK